MIPARSYDCNLRLIATLGLPAGAIVECGVWKGGMIAGIAKLLGKERSYYLFDSFEGLPDCREIDGAAAKSFQSAPPSPANFFNCAAEPTFAMDAMKIALDGDLSRVRIVKGWFDDTLAETEINEPIALLRLDCDWYDSTLTCLDLLFPLVADNGIIIIDDYLHFEGCSRAVHDYLAKNKSAENIRQFDNNTIYLRKKFKRYDAGNFASKS